MTAKCQKDATETITVCGGIKSPIQSPLALTPKELDALRNGALTDMKKHSFTTVEELEAYYDSKRGY